MAGRKFLVALVAVVCVVPHGSAHAGILQPTNCGVPNGTTPPITGGTGYAVSPYQVSDATELAAITGDLLDCDFIQTASFALSGTWTPIGSNADVFRGVYDGDGFTISGLSIPAGDDYLGLFGATHSAVIMDLQLSGVAIVGDRFVGGLIGYAQDTAITNVTVSGAVSGNYEVGGLVGDLRNDMTQSSINFGFANVTITPGSSPQSYFGGLVGFMYGSTISVANSTGSVTGEDVVGGLVGEADSGSVISYTRASGAVSGVDYVGGLLGFLSYSNVNNSYATGAVTATGTPAGGAVAYVEGTPAPMTEAFTVDVEQVYVLGAVSAAANAGGLIGYLDPNGDVSDSLWNATANPTLVGIAAKENLLQADIAGSTLTELQNVMTFAGFAISDGWNAWNTNGLWGICDGVGTPFLLWEYTSSPCDAGFTVSGFFQPVDMDGIENLATAGRVVPLKWRVLDGDGLPVSDPTSFTSMMSTSYTCPSVRLVMQDVVEKYVSKSGLRYLGDGYWQFNWATPKSYAGQCRTVTLTLSDDSTISADFRFRR